MGFMTTLTILNDGYSNVENNPEEFLAAIDDAMHSGRKGIKFGPIGTNSYTIGNASGVVKIAPTYHMDNSKLFLCECNDMYDLGKVYDVTSRKDVEFQLALLENAKTIISVAEADLLSKLELLNNSDKNEFLNKFIQNVTIEDIVIDGKYFSGTETGIEQIGYHGRIFVPNGLLSTLNLLDGFILYAASLDYNIEEQFIIFDVQHDEMTLKAGIGEKKTVPLSEYLNHNILNELSVKIKKLLDSRQ